MLRVRAHEPISQSAPELSAPHTHLILKVRSEEMTTHLPQARLSLTRGPKLLCVRSIVCCPYLRRLFVYCE